MVPLNAVIGPRHARAKVISSLGTQPKEDVPRLSTGLPNLDEMFGGHGDKIGLAQGCVVQLGGNPGIGKSTLLAQIAAFLRHRCLYVTTEESKRRLAARMRRVAGEVAANHVDAISTIDDGLGLGGVCAAMRTHPAKVIIIDSLQGLRKDDIPLEEREIQEVQQEMEQGRRRRKRRGGGSHKHSQLSVRDIALDLIREASKRKLTVIMTCHVTKDGALAGLKEIEHMVDVVAWFKGNPDASLRHVSCSKNREGDTMVNAEFDMTEHGLMPRIKVAGKPIVKLGSVKDEDPSPLQSRPVTPPTQSTQPNTPAHGQPEDKSHLRLLPQPDDSTPR